MKACVRPCAACPWRKDTHVRDIPNFKIELMERLVLTVPDAKGFGPDVSAPVFACHDSPVGQEKACAGWLAVAGHRHPFPRIWVLLGEIKPEQLEPSPDWPELHTEPQAVFDEMRAQWSESHPHPQTIVPVPSGDDPDPPTDWHV